MPIYEYYCPKCDQKKEVILLKIPKEGEEEDEQYCDHCKERISKILSISSKHGSWGRWNLLGD